MKHELLTLWVITFFSIQIHTMDYALFPIEQSQTPNLIKNAIRALVDTNNPDPLAIIPCLEGIKSSIPSNIKQWPYSELFEACMRDTTALNWLIHATNGYISIPAFEYFIKSLIDGKKYMLVNRPTNTDRSEIIRINGKNYQEDEVNGVDAREIEDLKIYCQTVFQPRIYYTFIDKEKVKTDMLTIKNYLLCLKVCKESLKNPPKPINNIIFVKSFRHIDDIKDCLNSINESLLSLIEKVDDQKLKKNCEAIQYSYLEKVDRAIEKISFIDVCNIIGYCFPEKK